MSERTGMFDDELGKEIEIDGVRLEVVTWKVGNDEWAVVNEYGIMSNWTDLFKTAQEAIDAGIKAIQSEGVKPFIDVEGFEYLINDK